MSGAAPKSVALESEESQWLQTGAKWGLLRRLDGKTVCMTGACTLRREDLADLVRACGGKFTNSMSGSVDLLLVARADSYSSKTREARQRGIPIVTEAGFVRGLMPTAEELLEQSAYKGPRPFDVALASADWVDEQ